MKGQSIMQAVSMRRRVNREQERTERRAIAKYPALRNKRLTPREMPGYPDSTKRQRRLRFEDSIGMPRPKR